MFEMECPECGSSDTESNSYEGDSFFECKSCGLTIQNNVETRASNKKKTGDIE